MSEVWQESSEAEAMERVEPSMHRLVGALAEGVELKALRSGAGAVAVTAPWRAVAESAELEAELEADAKFHRIALMMTPEVDEAGGLLRYADVVAIPGVAGARTEAPTGLVACGRLTVLDPTAPVAGLELYRAAPVDRAKMMKGAPVDLDVEEDLDAREDWFKKRHGGGD